MCRNIKVLHNFQPPATEEEIHASALQYVRKLSGSSKPAQVNQATFDLAVIEIAAASTRMLAALVSTAAPKNREDEAAKAKSAIASALGHEEAQRQALAHRLECYIALNAHNLDLLDVQRAPIGVWR